LFSVLWQVRFATYNTSLNRNKAGQLLAELQSGVSQQAADVSATLQTIRPDVLVLNEFDYEPNNAAVQAFQDNFLGVPQAPGLQALRCVPGSNQHAHNIFCLCQSVPASAFALHESQFCSSRCAEVGSIASLRRTVLHAITCTG
jgi:hypothetical protein